MLQNPGFICVLCIFPHQPVQQAPAATDLFEFPGGASDSLVPGHTLGRELAQLFV